MSNLVENHENGFVGFVAMFIEDEKYKKQLIKYPVSTG